MTPDEFVNDARTMDAVVRNLMTMGESIRWIPEPILDAHPAVPWRTLRGVRNVVVHEYFGVDPGDPLGDGARRPAAPGGRPRGGPRRLRCDGRRRALRARRRPYARPAPT